LLEAGTRIGDWIVDSPLDEGGMGAVYRCHNALSDRIQGALKVMDRHRADVSRDRFIREVEALASLRHEAVVRILGFGEAPEHRVFYIAMELVQGDSLARRIAEGPWPWPGPREVFLKLAGGLAHAHARGLAHRDIKPQNLMYTEDGSACIIDFGISAAEGRTSLTHEGTFLGTVTHMAPELFGRAQLDPMKADLYALGQVFYEVLTGSRAFSAQPSLTSEQRMVYVMASKMNSEALDPGPSSPDELRQLIRQTTHPDPLQRTPDLPTFLRQLQAVPLELPQDAPQLRVNEPVPLPPTELLLSPSGSRPVPPPPQVPTTGSGRRPDPGIPTRTGRRAQGEPTPPSNPLPPLENTGSGPSISRTPSAPITIHIPQPAQAEPTPTEEPGEAPLLPELDEPAPPPPLPPPVSDRHSVLKGLGIGLLVGLPLGLAVVAWQLGWFDRPSAPEPPVNTSPPSEDTTAPSAPPAQPDPTQQAAPQTPSAPQETPKEAPKETPKEAPRHHAEAPKSGGDAYHSTEVSGGDDVPMALNLGLSLDGDLYSRALSPVIEGRRSAFEACFIGAGAQGKVTDVIVTWSLQAGALTSGPSASGGSATLERCLTNQIRKISFDSAQTGTATLELEYRPQR